MQIELALKPFVNDQIDRIQQSNLTETPLKVEEVDDWKFVVFIKIFDKYMDTSDNFTPAEVNSEFLDWTTKGVGSFFIKNLKNFKKCKSITESITNLHQLFTLPNQNLSLPHIANIYAANHFKAYKDHPYLEDQIVQESLRSCILEMSSGSETKPDLFLGKQFEIFTKYLEPSPCYNVSSYPQCKAYCNWHYKYFKEWPKDDFITLMKFALPQRKLTLASTKAEGELAKKLFGKDSTGNLNHEFAPFFLTLFCYQQSKGFEGDDLGMKAKVCNNFFPIPTDQGICLTKNLNIKEIMNINEEYDQLFEPDEQKSDEIIKGGTYGSTNILVFFTGNPNYEYDHIEQNEFRIPKESVGENQAEQIQLKFHQPKEFPHFLEDVDFHISSPAMTLSAGMEYVIDVKPQLVKTTEAFKAMNYQQRKCKLEHEVEENSIFKVYTQKNCKYECYIKNAEDKCRCIPWDFMHKNVLAEECDIFGRTCFYNAMEYYATNSTVCDHCVKECDYTLYEGVLVKEESLRNEVDLLKTVYDPTYFHYFGRDQTKLFDQGKFNPDECRGESVFCDYFWPKTEGFGSKYIDQGLKNSYRAINNQSGNEPDDSYLEASRAIGKEYMYQHAKRATDIVIVHWRILKPEVQVIDAKYTILDKFANFGGNFGIFAEITGWSFLGILNLLILLFKLMFSTCFKKS